MSIGDRVRYRAEFCRSIGAYTGAVPFARGKVKDLKKFGDSCTLATVSWEANQDELPTKVNIKNLETIK